MSIFSQKIKISELRELSGELFQSKIKSDFSISFMNKLAGKTCPSAYTAVGDMSIWMGNYKAKENGKSDNAEFSVMKYYIEQIKNILSYEDYSSGAHGLSHFAYKDIPISVGLKKNKIFLLVHSLIVNDVYNTLKTNSKERANKVLSANLYRALNYMAKCLSHTEVKYLGLSAIYFSKDFSNDNDFQSLRGETLVFVAPIDKIIAFSNGEIQENDFLNLSEIFLFDRDNGMGIKVKL
jgi:hypothetical protein